MLLRYLLNTTSKNHRKIRVKGISFDSRKIKKNYIFFAIQGRKTSGTKYIKKAVSAGASAIVSDKKVNYRVDKIPLFLVKDTRKSLSETCSKFYKKKPKNIIAVTGTNGKSSVANFFYQILTLNKIPAATIGTLGINSRKYSKKTKLTSIDPLSLHKNLKILANKKINNIILEASSHGLQQKRLDGLNINTGIFTNLSHDHLDYHKNMKSYLNAKMYLFKKLLKNGSKIITDEDNKEFKIIKSIAKRKKIKSNTIGSNSGDLKILSNKYKGTKQIVKIKYNSKILELKIPLIGYFQIKNLFMAILAAKSCGLSEKNIFEKVSKIKPVSGRLECVANLNNNSNVIVDFAHTPDALEQSLAAIKKQFNKEIIIVFGCGGERDKKKRFSMGKIASKYCRKIFITDDNPRNENPAEIRKAIIKGCKKLATNIGNRRKAITSAIGALQSNEVLLIAGKGHEDVQDYGKKVFKFSDKKIVKKIIKKRKFFLKKENNQKILLKEVFNNNLKNFNYDGVSINTKTIKKNNLFFAIKGKKTDGHNFIKEAIRKGAAKLIVNKKIKRSSNNKFIKVRNTFHSLMSLAKVTRKYSSAHVIGITGSVGKTTLKNLISFSLKNYGQTYHSPHSYNNRFGVPLSLSNLKKNTDFGVFEIGMDKKGEIDALSKIVKPEIAVITNIGGAHFKNFNTLKDIAKAKAEIIDNISNGGTIILNKDDKFFNFLSEKARKKGIKIISFGIKKKSDIFLIKINKIKNFFRIKVSVKNKVFYFDTKIRTLNLINNILACISVLFALNLDLNKAEKTFFNFKIPEGRGDIKTIKKFNKKFKFIDESYNANPLSMMSAINNMRHYKCNKDSQKIALLGDMLELGKKTKKLHKELSTVINRSDVDKVFVYGRHIKQTFNYLSAKKKGRIFKNIKDAYNHFSKTLDNNDLLMIKGSNATGLNQLSKKIKKGYINAL
tara:strand:+ start:5140 stop:7986 length:2847 start_codon:yes stop_codon:yes gene_type:complete